MSELLKKNNLNSDILSPYKYLYITKETGKRYVFPLFNNSATFNSITNAWGEDSPNSSSDNDKVKKIKDFADSVISGVNFLNNLNNFISGKGDNTMTSLETAKCYNLNNSGETITTTFNLYNTTKVDAWKENFKFLFLFIARNLPLRIDIASYVPPYLYDIIVPGIKRLPVSYVSNINITPVGMIRTITCDDFLGTGDKITVIVPEAWTISISFTSLLAQTFNLLLAGSHGGMKVSTDIKTDEGQTA